VLHPLSFLRSQNLCLSGHPAITYPGYTDPMLRIQPLFRLLPLTAALTLALGACGNSATGNASARDPLTFSSSNVPVAYVGESYSTDLTVSGGAGPYNVRLAAGKLPDGLKLSGSTIQGKASKAGLYTFTLEASDAALSSKAQQISMTVAPLPPLSLAFTLPAGEIRGETRLPLVITAPRGVRALRYNWALPKGVSVSRVAPADSREVVYWKVGGGTLTMDIGFKSVPNSGARVALVSVKPAGPVTLSALRTGFSALGPDGKSLGEQAIAPLTPAKPAKPASPAQTAQPGATPASPASASPTQPAPAAPASTTDGSADPSAQPTVAPVAQPPAAQPPAGTGTTPPADTPPAQTPPAQTPPAQTPPTDTPPVQTPPSTGGGS